VVLRDTRRTHAGACVRRPDVKLVVVEGGGGGSGGGLCHRKESWGSLFRSQNCEGYADGFLTQNEGPTQRCGRGRRNTKEMSGMNTYHHHGERRFCKTISVKCCFSSLSPLLATLWSVYSFGCVTTLTKLKITSRSFPMLNDKTLLPLYYE
jgi:hypothetical protein